MNFLVLTLVVVFIDVFNMSGSCTVHGHHEMHAQWV